MHSTMTILNATEFYIFKWLIYVNFISIEKRNESNLDYIYLCTNVIIRYNSLANL